MADLAVLSHWFLDAVVNKPALPLCPGSSINAALGLWNSVVRTIAIETPFVALGAWIYVPATQTRDRIGMCESEASC